MLRSLCRKANILPRWRALAAIVNFSQAAPSPIINGEQSSFPNSFDASEPVITEEQSSKPLSYTASEAAGFAEHSQTSGDEDEVPPAPDLEEQVSVHRSTVLEHMEQGNIVRSARFRTSTERLEIRECWLDDETRQLHVLYLKNGAERKGRYPYIWLQDNCQSTASFHPTVHARLKLLGSLNPKLKPRSVRTTEDDTVLEITWDDGHVSPFKIRFLHERLFPDDWVDSGDSIYANYRDDLGRIKLWDSEMASRVRYIDFNKLMTDDVTLRSWIECLYRDGLVVITKAPPIQRDAHGGYDRQKVPLMTLSKRISFARLINYGEIFQVYSRPEASNLAYTDAQLNIHTDMPSYRNAPEIQLLHCIKQAATGGRNELVDGYKIAEHLRKELPAVYEILTNTLFDFREYGKDEKVGWFDLHSQHSVIEIDPMTNQIWRIFYSQAQRSSQLQVRLHKVEEVYNALMIWDNLLYDERFMVRHRMKDNEILCFNNCRVMHGREEFVVRPEDGERWLQGCYLEWDEVRSRYRSLRDVSDNEWDDVV